MRDDYRDVEGRAAQGAVAKVALTVTMSEGLWRPSLGFAAFVPKGISFGYAPCTSGFSQTIVGIADSNP